MSPLTTLYGQLLLCGNSCEATEQECQSFVFPEHGVQIISCLIDNEVLEKGHGVVTLK